jgi:hypothetical protein
LRLFLATEDRRKHAAPCLRLFLFAVEFRATLALIEHDPDQTIRAWFRGIMPMPSTQDFLDVSADHYRN